MVQEKRIDSFESFIQETINMRFHFKHAVGNYFTIFRGQEKDWSLLPSIGRGSFLSSTEILKKEKKIFDEFVRLSYPYLDSNLHNNKWNLLAFAQHHRYRQDY